MAQGETSDFEASWEYDGTPGEYPETSERLFGCPKFLSAPKYDTQGNNIRWRISGKRPLTVEVYWNGYQIKSFIHTGKGSVLRLNSTSRWRCGQYQVRVSNLSGAVIQPLQIRMEHLHY